MTTKKCLRLTFVGDVMCTGHMLAAYRDKEGDFNFDSLFETMRDYFAKSDLTVANLETPISFDNSNLTATRYQFCSPYQFAEAVKRCGIDIVSTANNHCLDRGIEGITSTVSALDRVGLGHTGVFADKNRKKSLIVNLYGYKIAVMAYTYGTNAFENDCYLSRKDTWRVNLFQKQELHNVITRFRKQHNKYFIIRMINYLISLFWPNDRRFIHERRESSKKCKRELLKEIAALEVEKPNLIIMYMHAGGQYNNEASPDTKKLANWLLDQGVDVVVGSHEHVVHGGEFSRKDKKVATFSLGNFDGIAGVYIDPLDKLSEYSIAWNLYVDPNKSGAVSIKAISFSVLKSIPIDSLEYGIKVTPAADLYRDLEDFEQKRKLLNDVREVAKCFCGKDVVRESIAEEYFIR